MTKAKDKNPLITFALVCYNQEEYIQEALEGALSQTYTNLEILISDDHSTDNTMNIARKIVESYNGSHIIRINQNKENLGLVAHINDIFYMSKGEYIVVAAGDDISLPQRVDLIHKKFIESNALLIHSRALEIDSTGGISGKILPSDELAYNRSPSKAAWHQSIYLGATGAWSKELINTFGIIKYRNAFEDQTMGFRAIIKRRISFIDEPLVKYRSFTGITNKEKTLKKQMINCIDIQKQKISDLYKHKKFAIILLSVASFRLLICLGGNSIIAIKNISKLLS